MVKLCGVISLVVFVSSAVCHVGTFIPAIPLSMNRVWPLHIATLGVFIFMAFFLGVGRPGKKEAKSDLLYLCPKPLRFGIGVFFIYAFINSGLVILLMEGGGPRADHGKYYLASHSRKIRELTEPEYRQFCAYEVRGFSGPWMLFSLVPTIYFLAVYPRQRGSNEPETQLR